MTLQKERIPIFDALKGTAILLMIINHVSLEGAWTGKFIGVFHMPLFFIISGYLYKQRDFKETIKKNTTKVLLPYILTSLVIWIIFGGVKGQLNWGLSILWGNSRPFHNLTGVGPLWFLTAFFWTMIYANILLRINSKKIRWIILAGLFAISVLRVQFTGFLLPFGITTGLGGVIFLFVGMEIKKNPIYINKVSFLWPGIIIWLTCVVLGSCAMAWHIYKLNLLQVIGGLYGTYVCYWVIKQFKETSFILKSLCFIGANSLSLFCIHSVDRVMNITSDLTNIMLGNSCNDVSHWQLEIILKLLFVLFVFMILRMIPFTRKIYQMNV